MDLTSEAHSTMCLTSNTQKFKQSVDPSLDISPSILIQGNDLPSFTHLPFFTGYRDQAHTKIK